MTHSANIPTRTVASVERALQAAHDSAAAHVFTRLYTEQALATAHAADAAQQRGGSLGPLHGLILTNQRQL